VYENWVNPGVTGNGGGVNADPDGRDGFNFSAALTLPGKQPAGVREIAVGCYPGRRSSRKVGKHA
jgi:hypothetical protein